MAPTLTHSPEEKKKKKKMKVSSGKSQALPKCTDNIIITCSRQRNESPDSDLQPPKPFHRRKPKTPVARFRKTGSFLGRRSRPETPLLKWNTHDSKEGKQHCKKDPLAKEGDGVDVDDVDDDDVKSDAACDNRRVKGKKKQRDVSVSVRKFAAGLWRLQQPEIAPVRSGFQVSIKGWF